MSDRTNVSETEYFQKLLMQIIPFIPLKRYCTISKKKEKKKTFDLSSTRPSFSVNIGSYLTPLQKVNFTKKTGSMQ